MNVITVGRKKLDIFFVLISFFMIILTFLIIYINKADRDMKNYTTYHKQIKELSTLDQKIENTFLQKYRYIDYDALQDILDRFEEILSFLNHQKFVFRFDKQLKDEITLLYATYDQKNALVQEFKSINARLTNSIHYLYDLHQTISDENNISNDEKKAFLNIFFQIEQLAMDMPNDLKVLRSNIHKIEALKEQSVTYHYFYQHALLFAKDINLLQEVLEKNTQIDLAQKIQNVSDELERHSQSMYEAQYQVSFIFFVFGILNLIFLIVNYKKINKLVQDLFTFKYSIENSDNLIIITDKNRRIEYVNEAFERRLGYSKEEIIGKEPNFIKSNRMSKTFYKNLNETLRRGDKWEGEIINRRKDGSLIYEKASITPIVNKNKIQGYLSIKLDITEYIEQRNHLQQLTVLFEESQDAMLVLDEHGAIVLANPSFLRMTQYSIEQLRQNPLAFSTNDKAILSEDTKDKIAQKRRLEASVEIITQKGETLTKEMIIVPVYDSYLLINYVVIYKG